jgi:hypothetical protein
MTIREVIWSVVFVTSVFVAPVAYGGWWWTARATKEEEDNAIRSSVSCLRQAAQRLDDHLSDATAVAIGIVNACGSELRHEAAVASQGFSFEAAQTIKRRIEAHNLEMATEIVLMERAQGH